MPPAGKLIDEKLLTHPTLLTMSYHAKIWKASYVQNGITFSVAIKSLRTNDTGQHLLMNNETQILNQLEHPNIIEYYGYYMQNAAPSIVMGIMANSLRAILSKTDHLSENKNPQAQALYIDIALGLARGLRYLHEQNIVHRDLKPDNILVNDDYTEVKICDFGLSWDLKKPNIGLIWDSGSIPWLSPEIAQFAFDKSSNPERANDYRPDDPYKIDIWPIGLIMLCFYLDTKGEAPIVINGWLLRSIADGKHMMIPNDKPLTSAITYCLQQDPAKRCNASQLIEEMNKLKFRKGLINHVTYGEKMDSSTTTETYRGRYTSKKIPVTVKIQKAHQKRTNVQRETNEILVCRQLEHPNIATFYGYNIFDMKTGIVMELMTKSLNDLLKDINLLNEEKNPNASKLHSHVAFCLAQGIHYLHKNSILHRHLRPDSVSTNKSFSQFKINDFELAVDLKNNMSQVNWTEGTPRWFAPEIAQLISARDPQEVPASPLKIDIWALGQILLLLYINNGGRPYAETKEFRPKQLCEHIATGEHDRIPADKPMSALITWCLKKNPAERPSAAQIVGVVNKL